MPPENEIKSCGVEKSSTCFCPDIEIFSRIPERFLNPLGFVNYDHYGNFPWAREEEEKGNVFLSPRYTSITQLLGIDCEMVGEGKGINALGRVSIVNEYGYCVYNTFVKPDMEVTDYRTKYSGIKAKDLEKAPSKDAVLKIVAGIVDSKILVGHAIENDLEVLELKNHPKIRDSALYFKTELKTKDTPSLKNLTKQILNADIQTGGHSSIQDAQATLKLYLTNREKWEDYIVKGRKNANLPDDSHLGIHIRSISEMRVQPIESDLFVDSKAIFLRRNKVIGAYSSCEEYLDVQFRLLLEDFLRPLRDGVRSVKQFLKNTKASLFHDVRIKPKVDENEIEVRGRRVLQVPVKRNHLTDIDWKETKTFLAGSLLLITRDYFKNVKFVVIESRSEDQTDFDDVMMKVKFLKDGPVWVVDTNEKFLVMESPAFYEAYKHSLKYLQIVKLNRFPMKKYIVDAETKSQPPLYLQSVTKDIDFSVLLKNSSDPSSAITRAKPLDLNNWPKSNDLSFDASQYEAFQKAVTQEMTIIQGPPGTGKTFIGIQIVKLLLTNPWLLNSPIFIVSQRNHSLDQALEMILDFITVKLCAGEEKKAEKLILRVGGGSKSKIILPLTILYKSDTRFRRSCLKDELDPLQEILNAVQVLNFHNLLLEQGILDFQKLPLKILQELSTGKKYKIMFQKWIAIENEMKKDPLKWFGIQTDHTRNENKNKNVNENQDKGDLFILSFQNSGILPKHLRALTDTVLIHSVETLYSVSELQVQVSNSEKIAQFATRWTYYFYLVKGVKEIVENIKQRVTIVQKEYSEAKKFTISRYECVKSAKVVGMTTTGAVKHKKLVLQAKPKIMIVEEAAHVLEAHVVASLTEHCQQMILIGDHQQLRPLTADYKLATDYELDVSLMERLVRNGKDQNFQNWTQLKVQHRMRPEIARMICPVIYEDLDNHPDVYNYPDVKGCSKNLFFVDHRNPENMDRGSRSYFNEYEARFVSGLIKYFIDGGYYPPSQITIICTYSAQKILIENELKTYKDKNYAQVRVSTVDGYQGEENDIVLLSLVRNNDQDNVGFLKTDNRVCVALSRARHGLFMIGNMSSLKEKSPTWAKVNETLEEMHCIGSCLPLTGSGFKIQPLSVKASNLFTRPSFQDKNQMSYKDEAHAREVSMSKIPAQSNKDFGKTLLKCGHSPVLTEKQMNNLNSVKCVIPVERKLTCGHKQKFPCHQKSGYICYKNVEKEFLCGHIGTIACWEDVNDIWCAIMVKKLLDCGHRLEVPCFREVSEVKCTVNIMKKLPCGHKKNVHCHQSMPSIKCNVHDNFTLPCGHQKKVLCHRKSGIICDNLVKETLPCGHYLEFRCNEKISDKKCSEMTESTLPCNHTQKHPCHLQNELKCSMNAAVKLPCGHEQEILCSQSSSEVLCKTLISSKCIHKVRIECHAAKNGSAACGRKCEKTFNCGHKCRFLCHNENDNKHLQYQCKEKCKRSCINGHPCDGNHECYKNCPKTFKMGCKTVMSDCSHGIIKCHSSATNATSCKMPCLNIFKCGHQCRFLCHEKDSSKHDDYKCIEKCQRSCPIDHPCPGDHSCHISCPIAYQCNEKDKVNCLTCQKIIKALGTA